MAVSRRTPRQRTLVVALALLSIVIVTLDLRSDDGAVSTVRQGVRDVFSPVDGVADAVTSPVADVFDGIFHAGELKDENEALRRQVSELQGELGQIQSNIRGSQELQGLLDLEVEGSLNGVIAEVTSGSPGNFQWTVQIDVGSADGIAEDMPVVTAGEDGRPVLLGTVSDVATSTATVRLLQDPDSRVHVWFPDYGRTGTLAGDGDADALTVHDVEVRDDALPVRGDLVETSGRDGSQYPRGIVVGFVSETPTPAPGEPATDVRVRPVADLERITRVKVVTSFERPSGGIVDPGAATSTTVPGSATSTPAPTDTTAAAGAATGDGQG